MAFLDENGLQNFWQNVKNYIKINNKSVASTGGNIVLSAADVSALSLNGSSDNTLTGNIDNVSGGVVLASTTTQINGLPSGDWVVVAGGASQGKSRQVAIDVNNNQIKYRTTTYAAAGSWGNWYNLLLPSAQLVTLSSSAFPSSQEDWLQVQGSTNNYYCNIPANTTGLESITPNSKIDIALDDDGYAKLFDNDVNAIYAVNNTQVTGTPSVSVYLVGGRPASQLTMAQLTISEVIKI